MGNIGQVPSSVQVDSTAYFAQIQFYANDDDASSTPNSVWSVPCTHLVKSIGKNPSYALGGIAISNWQLDDILDGNVGIALQVGPATNTKLLIRGSANFVHTTVDNSGSTPNFTNTMTPIVNGWYIYDGHKGAEDSIVYYIADDRHIMSSYYTLFGKMTYDPGTYKYYFLSNPNDKLIFNNYGWGDCLDSPAGPLFSPGYRYGHAQNGNYESPSDPPPGQATNMARKWRITDILEYLRIFVSDKERPCFVRGNSKGFGLMDLPSKYLSWPKGLNINTNTFADRTPFNFALDGADLMEGIMKSLSYAGPYTITVEPIDNLRNQIKVIDMSIQTDSLGNIVNSGVYVYHPTMYDDIGQVAGNPCVAADFSIKRSAAGYASQIGLTGDADSIELMASTYPGDPDCSGSGNTSGNGGQGGGGGLGGGGGSTNNPNPGTIDIPGDSDQGGDNLGQPGSGSFIDSD